jgi:hypothetical protein
VSWAHYYECVSQSSNARIDDTVHAAWLPKCFFNLTTAAIGLGPIDLWAEMSMRTR